MWAIMKAMPWESIEHDRIKIVTPEVGKGQPQRFIPVFDELLDAEKFAGDLDKHLIAEVRVVV